jgi:hypothetical protein
LLENFYQPFEEKFSVNDVKNITTDKLNNVSETPNLIIKTMDKKYIQKMKQVVILLRTTQDMERKNAD